LLLLFLLLPLPLPLPLLLPLAINLAVMFTRAAEPRPNHRRIARMQRRSERHARRSYRVTRDTRGESVLVRARVRTHSIHGCANTRIHVHTRAPARGEIRGGRGELKQGSENTAGSFVRSIGCPPFFPLEPCLVSLPVYLSPFIPSSSLSPSHSLLLFPLSLSLSLFLSFVLALARSSSRSVRDSSLSHFAARFAFPSRAHFPCRTQRQQHTRVDCSRSDPVGESRWTPHNVSGCNRDDEDLSRRRQLARSEFPCRLNKYSSRFLNEYEIFLVLASRWLRSWIAAS